MYNNRNIIAQIEHWNRNLEQEIKHKKYIKIARSPYLFFRGTNHLFWADFINEQRLKKFRTPTTKTYLQGDLHAYNFGVFDNNKGEIVYDFNDFDESFIFDYYFDLLRMAISIVLIINQNNNISYEKTQDMVKYFAKKYINYIEKDPKKRVHFFTKKNTVKIIREFLNEVEDDNSRKKMIKKWTSSEDDRLMFDYSHRKLQPTTLAEKEEIIGKMPQYQKTLLTKKEYDPDYFKVLDVARRVSSGTGSLGTPRYYILIKGDGDKPKEHHILDVKKQFKPCAFYHFTKKQQEDFLAKYQHQAQRHQEMYLAMNKHDCELIGWINLFGSYFSVRERSPYKEYFPTEKLDDKKEYKKVIKQWAKILANNHTHYNEFDANYFKKQGKETKKEFLRLITNMALSYSLYVIEDWRLFKNYLQEKNISATN